MAQNNPVGTHIVTDGAVGTRVFVGNTTPSYPTTGDLWIDNSGGSAPNQNFFSYTATGGETSVSVTYTVGTESVFLNGTKLLRGTDYVATSGTSITGLTALVASDIVEVVWFTSFLVNGSIAAATVTAKGDIIAATASGVVTNLPLGTNGQALIVDTTTSTGLKWSHDATEIPLSTVTAKGDVIVATASGAVTNLVVGTSHSGTNGTYTQELLVDSTTSSGLRWGDDNLILTTMGALI